MRDIDTSLRELGDQPADRSLFGLETRVWARIGVRQRAVSPAALWGWRSATAAVLLTVGLLTQGAAAQAPSEFELFSPRTALAPSTLLGDSQ
ncbi:MAG: hypothetical protein DCF16_08480 [Alphaproteobacteria bacterium]|nr:MAG: hypothetical protein DCF16_08480 [Alphaproteobacteria bacterium]